MELFFYNLVILIKLFKIRYLNLDKALLFPRNQAICLKNWKLRRASTTTNFYGVIFYNLVILIKLFKIRYLNLDKALLFPRNQAVSGKLKILTSSTKFNIFCWNFAHVSYLTISTEGCSGFFLILFRSWVTNENIKNECVESRSFLIFANNSRFRQNKNNSEHTFVDIGK